MIRCRVAAIRLMGVIWFPVRSRCLIENLQKGSRSNNIKLIPHLHVLKGAAPAGQSKASHMSL